MNPFAGSLMECQEHVRVAGLLFFYLFYLFILLLKEPKPDTVTDNKKQTDTNIFIILPSPRLPYLLSLFSFSPSSFSLISSFFLPLSQHRLIIGLLLLLYLLPSLYFLIISILFPPFPYLLFLLHLSISQAFANTSAITCTQR